MNELMLYLNAKGAADFGLLVANGVISTAIFSILLFVRRKAEAPMAAHARLARYAFVAVYGVLAARTWCGVYYTPVEPTEVAVNLIVLWLVWVTRGDLSVILDAVRIVLDRRDHGSRS
ncbi:phage holin family protein [Cupriavidus alkaliphilus]|uniref:phage holin family protein n=1 Tax=Cupriavidus alkaliphilus TaxID=942866 RepID=UPI00160EF00C|nr:phage holin family protein [Cupriavidus alkaliphilus]MBB2918348.1 fatty acid desaturase [Cupriavidus alkaliphilus]